MSDIRINSLPSEPNPSATDNLAIDGTTTRRATAQAVVNAGAPVASQAEAQAGTDAVKRMTPLTTKQSIASEVGNTVQAYDVNLDTISNISLGSAGTSILSFSLPSDVRNFLDTAPYVPTRSGLKALDPAKETTAILTESGREGLFNWKSGDYSTMVSSDNLEGIFLSSNTIASSSGAWVRLYDDQIVPDWFGSLPYSPSELVALNGNASVDTRATKNSAAIFASQTICALLGGGRIAFKPGIYVVNTRIERLDGIFIIGDGVGEWEPIFPTRPKTWEGTTLLFKGTLTRDITFPGITSMLNGGGVRSGFSIFSAYNQDATGTSPATAKQFSAAIFMKENVRYGGIRDIRICNWAGTDGISAWSDTASTDLGSDIDFGIARRNTEYNDDQNIQVVGGWREAAEIHCCTVDVNSASERNHVLTAKYQGRRGLVVRAPDIWAVTATTASTVTIRWSSEIYFSSAGGTFRGSNNVTYTYTGISHIGTADDYTFTGVTPDPSGIFQVRHPSTGFGNSEYQNVYAYGLDHQSGIRADSAPFNLTNSKSLEISGFPCRGVKFRNSKFHTAEPVVVHSHVNQDITYIDCQFEGGGHFIATPSVADQSALGVPAPIWETRGLLSIASAGMNGGVNLTYFTPRNAFVEELQLSPSSNLTGDFILKSTRSGKVVDIYGSDQNSFMRMEVITSITAGMSFVTVTSQTCTFKYVKIGSLVLFNMSIVYSGLDTTDTSFLSIRLPVDAPAGSKFFGTIDDRLSTGLNVGANVNARPSLATDNYLGIDFANTNQVAYTNLSAAGNIFMTGGYWIA